MSEDNGAGSEPPTSGRRPATPQSASFSRSPAPKVRDAAEAAILKDGKAARFALARQTALKAMSDPGVLTPKRLARLGADGMAHFVDELRQAALGSAKHDSANKPATRLSSMAAVASVKGKEPARYPAKPVDSKTIGVATIAGWWRSTSEGAPHFEAQARRHGWLAGSLAMLACLALLQCTVF